MGYLPFSQSFIARVKFIIIEIGSLQEHLDFRLALLKAHLFLEVGLLLFVDVCDSDFGLNELPEHLLEGNETAVALVNSCTHRCNVYHDEFSFFYSLIT